MVSKETEESKKPADDSKEAQERQRQREADARRIQLEAQQLKAREQEKRDREARIEQQTLVEPITVKNGDGTYISKDDQGRVKETLDAHNVTRTFEFDDKKKSELRAFTENNVRWSTEDGLHWNADGEKTRTMRVVVNAEDGAFGIVESSVGKTASTTVQFLNGSFLTKTGAVTELRDKDNALVKRTESSGAVVQVNPTDHTITLRDSNVQTNSQNQVSEVTYTDGSKAQFTYDSDNRLVSFTTKNGCFDATQMVNVQVDASGQLSYEQPAGTLVTIGLDNKEVRHDLASIDKAAQDIQTAIAAKDAKKIEDILTQMPPADHDILDQRYLQLTTKDLHSEITTNFGNDDVNSTKLTVLLDRRSDVSNEVGQIQLDVALIKQGNTDADSSISSVAYTFVDSLINKAMGTTGLAPVSIYMASADWQRATRAEQDLLQTIGLLGPTELDSFKNDFKNQTGQTIEDYIAESPISEDTKTALTLYLSKGREARTTADDVELAKLAIESKNLSLFQTVILLSHDRNELSQTLTDNGYREKLSINFKDESLKQATDYLDQGGLSVLTLLDAQKHLLHTDRPDVERILKQASPTEAEHYERGLYLASHPNELDSTKVEDALALKFYNDTKATLTSLTTSRTEVLKWESQLMKKETLFSELADAANDPQRLYAAVEKMSDKDWHQFRANNKDLKSVEDLLNHSYTTTSSDEYGNTYESSTRDVASPEVAKKLMEMLNAKLKLEDPQFSLEQSKTTGNRSITEIFDTDMSTVDKFQALIDTSDSERQAIRENKDGIRDKLVTQLDKLCTREGGDASLKIARKLLKEIDDGTKPTALDRAQLSVFSDFKESSTISGAKPSLAKIHTWEDALSENKDLLKGLQTHTDRDNELSFRYQLYPLLRAHNIEDGTEKFKEFENQILQNGRLDLAHCLKLTDKNEERLGEYLRTSDAEKAMLKEKNPSDPAVIEFQKSVFKDENEKALVQSVLNNADGKMTLADKLFAYTKCDAFKDVDGLKESLAKMPIDQRKAVAAEYFQKYGQLLSSNLADKLPADQRFMFKSLLSGADFNVRQMRMDTTIDNDTHRSYMDAALATFWNGGKMGVNESANQLTDWIAKNPESMKNLKPEDRERFLTAVKNYQDASQNYIKDKEKFAEQFTDAAITVAVMGSGLFTGFTSTAAYFTLLSTAAVAGGTFKLVATKTIQGTDFDRSEKNIASLMFRGGSEAAFSLIAPEFGVARVGQTVAKKSVTEALEIIAPKLAENALSKDAQILLTNELGNMSRQVALGKGEKFEELARKVLANGTKEEQELLAQTLRKKIATDVTTDLRENLQKKVLFELESAARSGITGTVAAAAPQLLATPLGLEKPEDMWERMKAAGIAGAEGALFFHVVFKGLGSVASLRKSEQGLVAGKNTAVQRDGKVIIVEDELLLQPGDLIVQEKLKQPKENPKENQTLESKRQNNLDTAELPPLETVLSGGYKIDPVTAETMKKLNLTPDSYVYRTMDPQFLDLKNSKVSGNPKSDAELGDPYNMIPLFPNEPSLAAYKTESPTNAVKVGPGLNVSLNDPSVYTKDGHVFVKIKLGDLLKQNGKIYVDTGAANTGIRPLYITFDGSVPFERMQVTQPRKPTLASELQSGTLTVRDTKAGGGDHSLALNATLKTPTGSREVVVDPITSGDGEKRLLIERQVRDIDQALEFDNFPATEETTALVNGEMTRVRVQEKRGDDLTDEMYRLIQERTGKDYVKVRAKDIKTVLDADPALALSLEETVVERLIVGDHELHSKNMTLEKQSDGTYKFNHIDAEKAFSTDHDPTLPGIMGNEAGEVLDYLSRRPLSEKTIQKLKDFIQKYDNPEGRRTLFGDRLTTEQVDALMARTKWFAENGAFPKAQTMQDLIAKAKKENQ